MTPAEPDSPQRGTASNDQVASARASLRAAVAAFEAIGSFARAEARPWDAAAPAVPRDPASEDARLAGTACALRHLADQFSGLSFADVLDAASEQYTVHAGDARAAAARARLAAEAIGTCERAITVPSRHRTGFWPPDTLSELRGYASRHGLDLGDAVARLTTRLLASLQHYADRQGADFPAALAAGLRAHATQLLRAGGPFETGLDSGGPPGPESRPPTAASFGPVATSQGVIISAADAEWLLIRTAARNQDYEHHGLTATPRDADDQRVLTEALAKDRGTSPGEILSGLAPQVAARVTQIEDGPAAAAALGREHGRTGTPPYCDLDIDGDATQLLHALGETEWMTDANHSYRVNLVIAYAGAYRQAAGHGQLSGDSPARLAGRDFPGDNPATQTAAPGAARPDRRLPAAPQVRPGHGPRPGA